LAKKEKSTFLEAYGVGGQKFFHCEKGRKETQIMMYVKNVLRVLTKLFKLKRKKWPTKQSARF